MNSPPKITEFHRKHFGRELPVTRQECLAILDLESIGMVHGFGWAMQMLSLLWKDRDPRGALMVGDCYGTQQDKGE